MKKIRIHKWTSRIVILIFTLVLFMYTMAFPSNTSWFILIFFMLLFLALFLSTNFSWGKTEITLENNPEGTTDIQVIAHTRARLPIFLPSLLFQLKVKKEVSEKEIPVYFQNQVHGLFQDVLFPRGHLYEIILCTYGKDHFGIFTHYSEKKVPVSIDIYPQRFPKYKSSHFLQKIYTHPLLHQYLKRHSPQFYQIREYQSQDPIKQVDWKASARKGKMMVKDYENEIIPSLSIIFVGAKSEYFEQLLNLAYTLYLELQPLIQLKLLLMGDFEGKPSAEETLFSFLTVEPESDYDTLMEIFKTYQDKTAYQVVIAPKVIKELLPNNQQKGFIYFTETDILRAEVNEHS